MRGKTKAVLGIAALIIGVLALIAVLLLGLVMVGQLSLSPIHDGTYEGQTIDYSHQRGIIFKTNDLTTKTHERSSQREEWCVPDDRQDMVDKVRNIPEGSEVRIEYTRPLWIWPDTCQGDLKVITDISIVNRSVA